MSFQNPDQPDKRICIGKITSAHGVKGLVKILPFGEDPALLEQVDEYKITLKNPMGKYILAEIEGVNGRDATYQGGLAVWDGDDDTNDTNTFMGPVCCYSTCQVNCIAGISNLVVFLVDIKESLICLGK